jgi:hypothetical protein
MRLMLVADAVPFDGMVCQSISVSLCRSCGK